LAFQLSRQIAYQGSWLISQRSKQVIDCACYSLAAFEHKFLVRIQCPHYGLFPTFGAAWLSEARYDEGLTGGMSSFAPAQETLAL
jgi:hypothetical protein